MLRESRARWLAVATAVVVVLMAAIFAGLRNRPDIEVTTTAGPVGGSTALAPAAPFDRTAALAAFERLNCAGCHSFEGRGAGAPLDRVGGRRNLASIRDYTVGDGTARKQLPAGIRQIKQRVAHDPDIDAVATLLAQSK